MLPTHDADDDLKIDYQVFDLRKTSYSYTNMIINEATNNVIIRPLRKL